VLPSPCGVSIENADAVGECIALFLRSNKGERFIGVSNRNVTANNGCDLIVGDPSNKIENGAWEIGI